MKQEEYYSKLKSLHSLYENVKYAIILAETLDDDRNMYIAPMNELRSALDHIFKSVVAVDDGEKCDYQLKEAKEHMGRAGCDALELLAGNLGSSVIRKLYPYSTKALLEVFPEYYSEVRPKLTAIQTNIAGHRQHGKTDSAKSFDEYFTEIKELIEINAVVDKMIPALQEISDRMEKDDQEQNRKKKKELLFGSFIGFISAALIALLTWLLVK